jgi:hypothetical protein
VECNLRLAASRWHRGCPSVCSEVIRDYLTHLAVRQRVSTSTQNQAFCAIPFLCREVIGVHPDGLSVRWTANPKPTAKT